MTEKHGPTQKELKLRIWVSLGGVSLALGTLMFRGAELGAAGLEAVVISLLFFGATLLWSFHRLRRGAFRPPD